MRISSKCRYAIAALIFMAQKAYNEEQITIISIAQSLGISKIYLEQVFSMLKKANIVISLKGSQGGYRLSLPPDKINVGEIVRAIETSLFEKTDNSVSKEEASIDEAMKILVWEKLDIVISDILDKVTLRELADKSTSLKSGNNFMFFI